MNRLAQLVAGLPAPSPSTPTVARVERGKNLKTGNNHNNNNNKVISNNTLEVIATVATCDSCDSCDSSAQPSPPEGQTNPTAPIFWLVHYRDRPPERAACYPPASREEVLAWHPDAVDVEPIRQLPAAEPDEAGRTLLSLLATELHHPLADLLDWYRNDLADLGEMDLPTARQVVGEYLAHWDGYQIGRPN
jgi:hypothetical protein